MLEHKLLSIYLNDHLAGSAAGVELARRALSNNRDTHYGEFLEWLVAQIAHDRQSLIRLMERLGIRRNSAKEALARALEKAGRFKPNARLTGYSPLSRLLEFEGLWMGVNGKLSLWRALVAVADADSRLDAMWLIELEARAEEQLQRIDKHRRQAARDAFVPAGQRSARVSR